MKFTSAALALAAFISSSAAQLTILSPGSSVWWVDDSQNDITWTCDTSPYENFTVLLDSTNSSILVSPYAFVANQPNYDCSVVISPYQMATFPAASGYTIILANTLNSSDIYAKSEEFAIKPEGSAYPATSATPTGTNTATSSASGSVSGSATTTGAAAASSTSASSKSSGANKLAASMMGGLAGVGALFGLLMA
ncbi:uncharacterized protein LAESUDRAFT_721809 [Laetiporus sulphureus 93-53]|uniref:Uncharacterized protein n=1 Tax=Laetiporus sulphureus 93-53 TaxID=1314785 RepID=A0A165GJT2_9APHY|nr:uncharacterized protein LAESUDRAFT_721809 [Laetiporus sulphureus 93-53]KZT10451.1 hypothetical protein LAESUDRAFT_721809 [Laetiporus sulphureus 93-53]